MHEELWEAKEASKVIFFFIKGKVQIYIFLLLWNTVLHTLTKLLETYYFIF